MQPIFIKQFLPPQILNLCYSYLIFKCSDRKNFEFDNQANSLVAGYSDYLMETIMDMSTSIIEQNVNKKLWPTYSYFRIYDKGGNLPIHTDRSSCEYTVALCLGCDPTNQPYEIFLGKEDKNSDYKYFDNNGNYNRYKIENKFSMLPNDALIFKGMDKIHWREYCKHDHYITVFLHYVDQEGEFKDYKFDKRNCLGEQKNNNG